MGQSTLPEPVEARADDVDADDRDADDRDADDRDASITEAHLLIEGPPCVLSWAHAKSFGGASSGRNFTRVTPWMLRNNDVHSEVGGNGA
jgi:hypothetical protein